LAGHCATLDQRPLPCFDDEAFHQLDIRHRFRQSTLLSFVPVGHRLRRDPPPTRDYPAAVPPHIRGGSLADAPDGAWPRRRAAAVAASAVRRPAAPRRRPPQPAPAT